MANLLGNIHETIVCIHFRDTTTSLFQIHPTQILKIICYIDIHFPLKKCDASKSISHSMHTVHNKRKNSTRAHIVQVLDSTADLNLIRTN